MTVDFLQAQKKQRYLILILTLAICLILLVVWWGFFREPAPSSPSSPPAVSPAKIEINWEALKDAQLEELKSFKEIPPAEGVIGRENPFVPY